MTHPQKAADDLPSRRGPTRVSRSEFLRHAAALGISASAAGGLFAACGGEDEAALPPPAATTSATTTEAAATTTAAIEGGTLRLSSGDRIKSFDPAFWTGLELSTMDGIYEGLVTYKPGTLELANELAASFEPSSDGTRFAFTLKEGILFHNGYGEVTADDVKYSYERIAGLTKPNINSPYAGDWSPLAEVKVTGKYSGEIILTETFAPLLRTTLPLPSGYVLSKRAVEELGQDYALNPIGTGPYQLDEVQLQDRHVLRQFDGWGGASLDLGPEPQWDEIVFLHSDEQATELALEAGELDFGRASTPESITAWEGREGFTVAQVPTFDYTFINMNVLHPKLADVRVRQAIRAALDLPSIRLVNSDGLAPSAYAIIPENMGLGYWPDAPSYDERDPGLAAALLGEAGAEGLELEFAVADKDQDLAAVVQQNLAEVGVKVDIRVLEGNAVNEYWQGEVGEKESQFGFSGYTSAPDPHWSIIWWMCDQVGAWNWAFDCNRQLDQAITAAARELDPDERTRLYVDAQRIMDEDVGLVWIDYGFYGYVSQASIIPSVRPGGWIQPKYFASV